MGKIIKGVGIVLLGLLLAFIIFVVVMFNKLGEQSQAGSPPSLQSGQLIPCPSTPNCVNSEFPQDTDHFIEPLQINPATFDFADLKAVIESMDGEVLELGDNHLVAIFTSSLFGFVDDVQMRFDQTNNTLHFLSASRVGHGDLGVNKERVEAIKANITNK